MQCENKAAIHAYLSVRLSSVCAPVCEGTGLPTLLFACSSFTALARFDSTATQKTRLRKTNAFQGLLKRISPRSFGSRNPCFVTAIKRRLPWPPPSFCHTDCFPNDNHHNPFRTRDALRIEKPAIVSLSAPHTRHRQKGVRLYWASPAAPILISA